MRYGCCGTGPAAMLGRFGDEAPEPLDPAVLAATGPKLPSLSQLFTVSVGAGLTVWFLTRLLSKHAK